MAENELAKLYVVIGGNTEELDKELKKGRDAVAKFSMAAVAVGASLMAAFGLAAKAAAQEQAGIARLSTALRNVGVDYNNVKGQLEAYISKQEYTTAFADDEQREALGNLVTITGDYSKSLASMGLVADVARGLNMDLATAAEYVGRALEGNATMLARQMGMSMETATATDVLRMAQERLAGQSAAYAKTFSGQMDAMKNSFDNLKEIVGGYVIEAIQPAVEWLVKFIRALNESNPQLLKMATYAGMAVGGFALLFGSIGLFVTKILPTFLIGLQTIRAFVTTTLLPMIAATWPYLLLIAGVAMMAYGIWTAIRASQGEKIESNPLAQLKKDLNDLVNTVLPGFQSGFDSVGQSGVKAANDISSAFETSMANTAGATRNFFTHMKNFAFGFGNDINQLMNLGPGWEFGPLGREEMARRGLGTNPYLMTLEQMQEVFASAYGGQDLQELVNSQLEYGAGNVPPDYWTDKWWEQGLRDEVMKKLGGGQSQDINVRVELDGEVVSRNLGQKVAERREMEGF